MGRANLEYSSLSGRILLPDAGSGLMLRPRPIGCRGVRTLLDPGRPLPLRRGRRPRVFKVSHRHDGGRLRKRRCPDDPNRFRAPRAGADRAAIDRSRMRVCTDRRLDSPLDGRAAGRLRGRGVAAAHASPGPTRAGCIPARAGVRPFTSIDGAALEYIRKRSRMPFVRSSQAVRRDASRRIWRR